MDRYDYRKAIKNDILEYINANIDLEDFENLDELAEYLNEELWTVDSVTGNEIGSYTLNTYEAEENLCHNLDLLSEAFNEFGLDMSYQIEKGAEACDVTIRCYLLSECISECIDEIEQQNEINSIYKNDNEIEEEIE